MDYRDELDRAAKTHGYEERENEPKCENCIHQPMCCGKNCHFDPIWERDDLKKKYYHVNDFGERMSDKLYSRRDQVEEFADWDCEEGPFFQEKYNWMNEHPKKTFHVRMEIMVDVEARDDIEARKLACEQYRLQEDEVEADIVHEYRMPVEYCCCEEGHTYRHEYTRAKNKNEAKFKFMSEWIPDIEASPDFEYIEEYDDEEEEWL